MPASPHSDAAREYAHRAHYYLAERGSGHLVVFLHGLGGDNQQPLGLTRDALESTGVSVLAPDARAHGRTPIIGPASRFDTASQAEDIVALIEELGLGSKRLIPIGISMGAAVSLDLARRYPSTIAGAIAIRPSFEAQPWPEHLRVFREIASLLRRYGPSGAATFEKGEAYKQVRAASRSAADSLLNQFTKPKAVERAVRLDTVPGNVSIDWDGRLTVECPITVVAAAKDPGHPEYVAELWRDRIAGTDLVRVPSRDDDPARYSQALEETVIAHVRAWASQ
jgi:pimeloyl-ACP methyl ester carboxylesterase